VRTAYPSLLARFVHWTCLVCALFAAWTCGWICGFALPFHAMPLSALHLSFHLLCRRLCNVRRAAFAYLNTLQIIFHCTAVLLAGRILRSAPLCTVLRHCGLPPLRAYHLVVRPLPTPLHCSHITAYSYFCNGSCADSASQRTARLAFSRCMPHFRCCRAARSTHTAIQLHLSPTVDACLTR